MLKTVTFAILASISYSFMSLMMKFIGAQVPETLVVFFRFLVSTIWVFSVIGYKAIKNNGQIIILRTKHPVLYLLRSLFTISSMLFLQYALRFIPLANASVLNMSYALILPVLSYLVYHYTTDRKIWLAIVLGFLGVFIILNPAVGKFNSMAVFAFLSGLSIACSLLQVAELVKYDQNYTIMGIHFPLTLFLSAIGLLFTWQTPSIAVLKLLLLAGVGGTCYMEFFTRAMKRGPTNLVVPIQYFGIIFSGLLDWFFWNKSPSLNFILGSLVVTFACFLVSYYTEQNKRHIDN